MGADRRVSLRRGTAVVRGAAGADVAAVELIEAHTYVGHRGSGHRFARGMELGGARVFAKGNPLQGRAALRHGLRRRLLGRPLPRVREYENLRWLGARIFQVPRPFAAAVWWHLGLPRYQVLVMEEVPDARPLDAVLPEEGGDDRTALARELGGEVARMHALGFVHRDLFPRNLLVLPRGAARRLVFVDAWRAAPHASLRGPAYDLACLFLEGADLWSPDEQQALLDAYAAGRAAQERPAAPGLLARARREREALLARLLREPGRLRGRPLPGPWSSDLTL